MRIEYAAIHHGVRTIKNVANPPKFASVQRSPGRDEGRISAVPQWHHWGRSHRTQGRLANILAVTRGLPGQPGTFGGIDVPHSHGRGPQAPIGIGIDCIPVLKFLIVFQLARGEQTILPDAAAVLLGSLGRLAFLENPVGCFQNSGQLRTQKLLVPRVQIMFGQGPENPAVIQVISRMGIIVVGIDPNPVENGGCVLESTWEGLRSLQLDNGL